MINNFGYWYKEFWYVVCISFLHLYYVRSVLWCCLILGDCLWWFLVWKFLVTGYTRLTRLFHNLRDRYLVPCTALQVGRRPVCEASPASSIIEQAGTLDLSHCRASTPHGLLDVVDPALAWSTRRPCAVWSPVIEASCMVNVHPAFFSHDHTISVASLPRIAVFPWRPTPIWCLCYAICLWV